MMGSVGGPTEKMKAKLPKESTAVIVLKYMSVKKELRIKKEIRRTQ